MTTTTAPATGTSEDPVSHLQRLPGSAGNDACLLAGKQGGLNSFLTVWLPVVVVFGYGSIAPFLTTQWSYNNLVLVLAVWSVIWLCLTPLTLASGSGRHIYALDLYERTITHLNTGESTSLALELYKNDDGDRLDLKTPLASGWHLNANARSIAELEHHELDSIPEWQPDSLKNHIEEKAKDGSLLTLFIFATIFWGVFNLMMGSLALFVLSAFYLLLAWLISQTTAWLIERKDCQLND